MSRLGRPTISGVQKAAGKRQMAINFILMLNIKHYKDQKENAKVFGIYCSLKTIQ